MAQSRVNMGETQVTFNGEELTLVPNHRAFSQISRQYDGLKNARDALVAENVDAISFVLRVGTKMSDKDSKDLPEKIYENGVTAELLIALIKYVAVLGNKGQPLDLDDEKENESNRSGSSYGTDEGNG